jgi:two-component system sensor histidine kinase BarA
MERIRPSRPGAALPVRDQAAALRTAGGNPGLAAELFSAFLTELPRQIAQIRRHWHTGDYPALRDGAHRLHGSSAYCGVPALMQAVKDLELAAQDQETEAVHQRMADLEREMERLLESGGGD